MDETFTIEPRFLEIISGSTAFVFGLGLTNYQVLLLAMLERFHPKAVTAAATEVVATIEA